jgi:hypothetical protein
MTAAFLVAFGGPLLLGAIGCLVIAIVRRPLKPTDTIRDPQKADIDASLAEAQIAARRVETEIAKVRARIAL